MCPLTEETSCRYSIAVYVQDIAREKNHRAKYQLMIRSYP